MLFFISLSYEYHNLFSHQDETKRLFAVISKRDRAIFLTVYRHEQRPH
jgi:hypothetical protein